MKSCRPCCCLIFVMVLLGATVSSVWMYRERHREVVQIPAKKEVDVTLIEGWTVEEMDEYLVTAQHLEPSAFLNASKLLLADATLLGTYSWMSEIPKTGNLDGYVFPDTYRIYEDSTAQDLLRKVLGNFDRKLTPELREEIKNQKKTIFEIITVASILEEEVRSDMDRALVADIIYRRLKMGMPLQMDSTVNYVTGKKDHRINNKDREVDSPYNTYKYPGLPAGPIANPSLSAIVAAIHPSANKYYYFLTDASGVVHYAKTNDEHNVNKYKYLK